MSAQVQARSPELDELSCVPETQQSQQAAGVEEVVVGVEDPLQGDIALETQQDSHSSDDDIAATILFSAVKEQKLVDFLCDNEIRYNKRLKDYKDRSKREAVWDQFCNNLDKDACQR